MDDPARRTISVVWICPQGHVTWPKFDAIGIGEQMRRGGIELQCNTCGRTFPAEARVVGRLQLLVQQGKL